MSNRPKGARPIGVSNVDYTTEVWLVIHDGVGFEVVQVADFNKVAHELKLLKEALALPTLAAPQPPVLLPDPPSHEQSYANNLTEALREVNELRNLATALTSIELNTKTAGEFWEAFNNLKGAL